MATEKLMATGGPRYVQMKSSPPSSPPTADISSSLSFRHSAAGDMFRIFDELPKATIISVSRPDPSDISPMQLSYTIEVEYKQFKWELVKKAHQVFILHFALKKRVFIEEIHEKQEQVKEWLHNLGIGEHATMEQDDDEGDDETVPLQTDESAKNRDVPSSAALPIIRPALGRQHSIADRARSAMQGYLNHFLGNISIVNSPEVCKFLEVSMLSFSPEYGPKLKEEYVMVKHLPKIKKDEDSRKCCLSDCFNCCNDNWQKVWAVLKPGFLALLAHPFASLHSHSMCLSPDDSPLQSVKSCFVGRDGVRHLILCRVILGRTQIVKPDTKQCYPSCEDYDSGVDSFSAPTKYVIWSSRINTHVWPAYVISFRVPSFKGGSNPIHQRLQLLSVSKSRRKRDNKES